MLIDQAEIDALLNQADQLVDQAAELADAAPAPQAAGPEPAPDQPSPLMEQASPQVARILRIRVPVIVRLAQRRMPISAVRQLSCGGIIEFDKSIEEPLDLLINNRAIGHGEAVKVGENFGLRVTGIADQAGRIKSMGR